MQKQKLVPALVAALVLSVNCAWAMPNPVVEYSSQTLAERAIGFPALSVNLKSGFTLTRADVIAHEVIELEYVDADNRKLTLRTAKYTGNNPDISGIYGAKWYEWNVGDLYMHTANLVNNTSASYWNDRKYAYAVIGENVQAREFQNLATAVYMSLNPEEPAQVVYKSTQEINTKQAMAAARQEVPSTANSYGVHEKDKQYELEFYDNPTSKSYTALVDAMSGKVTQLKIVGSNIVGSTQVVKTPEQIKKLVIEQYPDAANVQVSLIKEGNNSVYLASCTTLRYSNVSMKLNPVTAAIGQEIRNYK